MNPRLQVWCKANTKRQVKVFEVIRKTQDKPIMCFEPRFEIKLKNAQDKSWIYAGTFVNKDDAIELAERIFAEVKQ